MRKVIPFIVLLGLVVFAGPAYAPPASRDVNVVNEPTVHVGTMPDVNIDGDVNVVNEPNVNAYQAGKWSVNIESATKTMKEFSDVYPGGSGFRQVYQVPTGKRFILTDVYFNQMAYGPYSNVITLDRNDSETACGIGTNYVLWIDLSGPEGSDSYRVFLPLQTGYEFIEGERICLAISGGGNIFYNLSGYETDL